ncbi:MAG: hemin ABC transporter substrate-binding protein [Rhizobiaceae bacterium]
MRLIGSTFTLLLALAASVGAAWSQGVTVLPDTTRVVSIGGSITEIAFALGEQNKLVARDSTSVFPPEAFKLPDVGYMRQLAPEGVLSVNPTGIVALQGSGPREAVEVLKKASIPYVEVPETFDHQGILVKVRAVGKALSAEAKAEALAIELDKKLTQAERQTAAIKHRKRILFILSFQGGKILGSGGDTAADGIIRLAGAVNAVEGFAGYKQLSDEAIIASKPDVILMMDRSRDHGAKREELFAHPALASTPAAAEKQLIRMDGAYLLGFGPRTAEAIHDLAKSLYGDELGD